MGSRERQFPLSHLGGKQGTPVSSFTTCFSPSYSAVAWFARYDVGCFNYSGRIRPSKRGFVHPGDSFDLMQIFSSTERPSEYKMESTVKNGQSSLYKQELLYEIRID